MNKYYSEYFFIVIVFFVQNWTVKQMFQMSEKFFNSLGMENMTRQFWEQSIIEKRNDVEMVW